MSTSPGPEPTSDDRPTDDRPTDDHPAEETATGATPPLEENGTEAAADSPADPSEAGAPEADAADEADAAEAEAPRTELEALRAEHEELRAEHQESSDRLLRTAAELQNVRRRAAKEQRRRAATARASALRPLLEVLDDLQRALAADADADDADAEAARQSLRDGVEMVEAKFEDALAGQGVEPIEAEGQPFDETVHEAMMQQPAPEGVEAGTVLAEIRRGYRMATSGDEDGRVLRHSRVVVAAAPASPAAEEEGEAREDAEE